MTVRRLAWLMGVTLMVTSGSMQALHSDEPAGGKQVARESPVSLVSPQRYWLYLPEGYTPEKKYPLVLFLHGRGERGSNLEAVLTHGPPKLVKQGKSFPFIMVAPQLDGVHMFWQTNELLALLDHIEQEYSVDADRVYCTGLSMGGFATWALGVAAPERFAALLPICGGGDPPNAARLKHVPTWVFHGAEDPVVPVGLSEQMVNAMKKAGGTPRFTSYPGVKHDSWTETYNNPEIYEWMLQQQQRSP